MKSYYRVMLGKGSFLAQECFAGNFIAVGFGIAKDLTQELTDDRRAFNREFIPVFMRNNPGKEKIAAGLACGIVWTVSKGMQIGDIVVSSDGQGIYHVGEVTGNYYYQAGDDNPHRRPVHWFDQTFSRDDMSEALQTSALARGTVINLTRYGPEIEQFIGGIAVPQLISTDATVEDPSAFAMEKHLEDFLVQNWSLTELGRDYEIYQEEGEVVGEQYETDTGPIDILAISKDKKCLLVVELKKGRASDVVVGQILRYMGYVKEVLAEAGQDVKGAIIALEDDQRIRRALAVSPNIEFYRYQVSFKLVRG